MENENQRVLSDPIPLGEGLTFDSAKEWIAGFLKKMPANWTLMNNRFYLFTHLAEEIGELARSIMHLELRPIRGTETIQDQRAKISEELADVLYHIFKISIAYGIDIEMAFREKMRDNESRFLPLAKKGTEPPNY